MVKLIDGGVEEIKRAQRISKLTKIAMELLHERFDRFTPSENLIMIVDSKNPTDSIRISYPDMMSVNDAKMLRYAKKLAQEYESRGEQEFTVKKNY